MTIKEKRVISGIAILVLLPFCFHYVSETTRIIAAASIAALAFLLFFNNKQGDFFTFVIAVLSPLWLIPYTREIGIGLGILLVVYVFPGNIRLVIITLLSIIVISWLASPITRGLAVAIIIVFIYSLILFFINAMIKTIFDPDGMLCFWIILFGDMWIIAHTYKIALSFYDCLCG